MKKYLMLGAAALLALNLCGCAAQLSAGIAQVSVDVNTLNAALNTPAALQAEASLKAAYGGVVCGISKAATLVGVVAADVKATKTVGDAKIVAMTSADLCTQAGGTVVSPSSN